jgi:hypothetical protein
VEELFEVRRPKNLAPVAEITGKVEIEKADEGYLVKIKNSKVKPNATRLVSGTRLFTKLGQQNLLHQEIILMLSDLLLILIYIYKKELIINK